MWRENTNIVEGKTIKLKSCRELSRKRTISVKRDNATKSFQEINGIVDREASVKLQVSFAEYSLFYRTLLQKRPIILRSLLLEATCWQR